MGGCSFETRIEAWDAKSAFDDACERAQHDHGHAGYTGTIAEKHSFTIISPPSLDEASAEFREWYDKRMGENDKWGPAFCVVLREPEKVRSLTKAQARKQAPAVFGSSADVKLSRGKDLFGKPYYHAQVCAERDEQQWGMNERLPNGKWLATVASADGASAEDAYGRLFAKKGLYLFFGFASS